MVSHSLFEQLLPRVVEFIYLFFDFCVVMNLGFWDFEEWANRANVFPVFRIGLKVA